MSVAISGYQIVGEAGFVFASQPKDREYEDPLNSISNSYTGNSRTWITDLLWKWSPNGNSHYTNVKLQGEYFYRTESGDLVYDSKIQPNLATIKCAIRLLRTGRFTNSYQIGGWVTVMTA